MDLTNRNQLIGYLKQQHLYTKKSLGQNFLVDRCALDKIVEAAELSNDDCVIEVGPGLGVMTEELVKKAESVVAVELDQILAGLLVQRLDQESQTAKNLKVINADILKTNIAEVTEGCEHYKVVANIPYYITSKIIRYFLELQKKPETIVLLTQKEVAERICAKPGDMSLLAVSVQAYGDPEIVGIVKAESFFPAPEVDSAILRIKNIHSFGGVDLKSQEVINPAPIGIGVAGSSRRSNLIAPQDDSLILAEKNFFRCVHVGFAARRKTLLNNLSAGYQLDKQTVLDILEKTNLTERTRAQELDVEKWKELCLKLQVSGNKFIR